MLNDEKIKKFIENNNIKNLGIKEISYQIGVSNAAISRFARKNGFSSFHELQLYYNRRKTILQNSLKFNDPNYVFSLSKLINTLDYQKINFIAKTILKKERVVVIAEGYAELAARFLIISLRKINLAANFQNSALNIYSILPEKNCAFIFISYSGQNYNHKRIMEKIKPGSFNSAFFLLTARDKSSLSSIMNETITSYAHQENINKGQIPLVSHLTMQAIISILFERIYYANKAKNDAIIAKLERPLSHQ